MGIKLNVRIMSCSVTMLKHNLQKMFSDIKQILFKTSEIVGSGYATYRTLFKENEKKIKKFPKSSSLGKVYIFHIFYILEYFIYDI